MKLFLHVYLTQEPPQFDSEWPIWVKKQLPLVSYFDVDLFSDQASILTAEQAIIASDKLLLLFSGQEDQNPGKLLKLVKATLKFPENKPNLMLLAGANRQIEQLLRSRNKLKKVADSSEIKDLATRFFTD